MVEQTYMKLAGIDGIPTINGCSINNIIPSGTYVDILYKAPAGVGQHSGNLSGNIYDYDMIRCYCRSIGASGEACMGTVYCPKDIPLTGGRPFLYSQFGAGNFYLNAATITFNNGSAFTSTGFNTYPCMQQQTTSTHLLQYLRRQSLLKQVLKCSSSAIA